MIQKFNLENLILAAVDSSGVHDGVVEGGGVHVQRVDQLASLGRGSQVLSGSLQDKSFTKFRGEQILLRVSEKKLYFKV